MFYKHGDWWAICDVCQRRFYGSQLKKRWDNLMVCSEDWETRHPQDFVRSTGPDPKPLPWTRPDKDGIDAPSTINCNTLYPMAVPRFIDIDTFIGKGYTVTPVITETVIIPGEGAEVDGVWAAGVWAPGVWANDVWRGMGATGGSEETELISSVGAIIDLGVTVTVYCSWDIE